ncbi:hypothetical protein RHMOL_Rhmol01G0223800 [Rhododendron molle]|uniref:Uncharacterized protein n=1 Tax=Rhododendron molle TaxID=49168 RepID=A0ACC0Q4S2_RHOML|nr:hypothetical protein RHMOL_Rhmol01G0223800 [Rhododendron molle]
MRKNKGKKCDDASSGSSLVVADDGDLLTVFEAIHVYFVAVVPFVDEGFGGLAAVAEREPELRGEVAAKEEGRLGGGGKGGDLRGGEEGEDAKLDVFWEVREGG